MPKALLQNVVARYRPLRRVFWTYGGSYWRLPRVLRASAITTRGLGRAMHASTHTLRPGGHLRLAPPVLWRCRRHPTVEAARRGVRVATTACTWVDGCALVGEHATPVTSSGRLVLSPFRDEYRLLGAEPRPDLIGHLTSGERGAVETGPVVSLVHRLDPNYYHWMLDILPTLEVARVSAAERGLGLRILVREGAPKFVRESLTGLGVRSEDVQVWPRGGSTAVASALCVVHTLSEPVGVAPESLRWVREKLSPSEVGTSSKRGLAVLRSRPCWRSILNDDELYARLEREGFEVIRPESLSFGEQVAKFASARVVVGLHGAGLTNFMFSRGGALLELRGNYGGCDYYRLAAALNRPYGAVEGSSEGDNVRMNVDDVMRAVERLEAA